MMTPKLGPLMRQSSACFSVTDLPFNSAPRVLIGRQRN